MNEREKVIELTEEKFFKEGFYKTTMDDIASELKMSKKTIYKIFPSKEELVLSIAKHFMEKMKGKMLPILNSEKNAIEKLEDWINILTYASRKISPKMFEELQRHAPNIWNEIDEFRTRMMFGNITKIIEQGKTEGLFIDYPTPIVMYMLVSSVRTIVNPEFIINNNFSLIQAALVALKIIIGGIVTEKGREVFNQTINQR